MTRTMRNLWLFAVLLLSLLPRESSAQASSATKAYELRIYTASPGRLPDLVSLLGSTATQVWAQHRIQNVFDGTVLEGAPIDGTDANSMVVCIVAHENREAADKAWSDVENDDTWKTAWARAQQAGHLLAKPPSSLYLTAAEITPAAGITSSSGTQPRIFELRKYNTGAERLPATVDQFQEGLASILAKVGMTPIIYWTADDRSSFVYLLAHKDREAARASWTAFLPEFRPFMAELNARRAAANPPASNGGAETPPARRTPDDNRFLVPTSFSPLQ